ncbi:DUF1697 domain-containing protein [Rhizobium lentis]|uniref:DUF1697 domain-containing protein n=1 Tax=Rhizobium lentis TaxID=1138194 RepID=UPI001C83F445|nr:DUF1697 domain-containing protein [Rhizobium lentis]MBX4972113.1 DUF1697 domain-containing protein [Rhizobium lentis]MBX5081616.1 DUF1697 domain-containing protein [Rhizobium lentis]MBX5094325.1 DUF1697 domain-containing protein [Rhizobium lentis]MBX5119051.1 DUF1697 domain-containing protein [Rhizobium lentis]MBX5125374.1 DUF1697 domain-containing protein [Rhizobium lentis]
MSTFIALLHSIVLTPDRRVIMEDLRALATELGYREPRTLVSTGNLVFEADELRPHELEVALEEGFEPKFGKHVDIIVRSDCTWMALCSTNPFRDGSGDQVIVRVMRLPVDPQKVEALKPLMTEGQRIAIVGGDLWIDFAGKPSQSKLLSALTTKRIGIGTMRNWNTVCGLAQMIM